MNEKIKFSIVIPVYNRINNLENCISDISSQEYNNYEIILVDDFSTDGSKELCDKLASNYASISVIHHTKNQGASISRNDGLAKASGDYILFLDSDDRFEHNMLNVLATSINKYRPDVVVYSLIEEYYNSKGELTSSISHSLPTEHFNTPQGVHKIVVDLEKETMYGYPWNKAYNLSFLLSHQCQYPVIDHVEDILFNIDVFENVNSLLVLEDKLYHYINQVSNRLTDKYLSKYFELQCTRLDAFYKQQERWNTLDEKALNVMAGEYFRWLMSAVERELHNGTPKENINIFLNNQFNSDLYNKLHDHFTCGKKLQLLYAPLLEKNSKKSITYAKFISTIKRKLPGLFAKLKQNR